MDEFKVRDLTAEDVEFVQADTKIYDKKFETKPVGYFKDAMIRFSKNRTNVYATIILFTIIFSSILVPIISTKNAEVLEEQLAYLPPRMPILENIGIFDGNEKRFDKKVDLSTIDPETGLGIPEETDFDLILPGTLRNYTIACSKREELCVGGQNQLILDPGSDMVSIESTRNIYLSKTNEAKIYIDITRLDTANNSKLDVYIVAADGTDYLVDTITTIGLIEIDPFANNDLTGLMSHIKLEFYSERTTNTVIFRSIEVYDNTKEDPIFSDTGYDLSLYEFDLDDGSKGNYVRLDGEVLMSAFTYESYTSAFGDKYEIGLSASRYDELMEKYPNECVEFPDPGNSDGWRFSDSCPVSKVIKVNESVPVCDDETGICEDFFSYELILNYKVYKEYDTIPYYVFGTTAAGKDLFKLMWIGTRTSLLIGLIVASINITVGIVYGAISGYYGGKVDILMQRFSEIIGRIPWLVTLSIFVTLIGPGILTLILILIISGWIGIASITRTQFYRYKGREYVLASRTLGAKDKRLIFRHILPNGIGTIITSSILSIPYVIFSEATISYLGFGIGHGQQFNIFGLEFSGVSIGVLLSDGRTQLTQKPYLTLFPAVIISVLMITFNMFGNALRDAFNPALRGSE